MADSPGRSSRLSPIASPPDAPVYVGLSLLWALFEFTRGSLRFYLLSEMSPSEYVIWSRIAHWPLTGLVLGITVVAVWVAASRYHNAHHGLGATHAKG